MSRIRMRQSITARGLCGLPILLVLLVEASAHGRTVEVDRSGNATAIKNIEIADETFKARFRAPASAGPLEGFLAKLRQALDFNSYEWTEVNPEAPWAARAGLESVELNGKFYIMGGRSPLPPPAPPFASRIRRDVWMSPDRGVTWKFLGLAPWKERAFFEAVVKDGYIYVMGGQNFETVPGEPFPVSEFFNDVWRTADGIRWERMTAHAGWAGRAGLSSVVKDDHIYVFAGAEGDDEAIGGEGRTFFTDVWKSYDGRYWERVVRHVPWRGRGGTAAVVKNGWIYLMGGEEGFLLPQLGDVWRSRNAVIWHRVTPEAWQPRSGHKCGVLFDHIVCFGGFGIPQNPTDVQVSRNGRDWTALDPDAAPPWQVLSPVDIKFDFDIIVTQTKNPLHRAIYTFGGDRETFGPPPPPSSASLEAEFALPPPPDPKVDNDVWRFNPGPLD